MKTTMTREQEIATLQSLKGDTYFGQVFDNDTIDKMCENIKNDFGIECGVELLEKSKRVEKAESDKRRLQHENNDLQDEKDKLVALLFGSLYNGEVVSYTEKRLAEIIGMQEVVVYKLKFGFELNDKERAYAIEKLKK